MRPASARGRLRLHPGDLLGRRADHRGRQRWLRDRGGGDDRVLLLLLLKAGRGRHREQGLLLLQLLRCYAAGRRHRRERAHGRGHALGQETGSRRGRLRRRRQVERGLESSAWRQADEARCRGRLVDDDPLRGDVAQLLGGDGTDVTLGSQVQLRRRRKEPCCSGLSSSTCRGRCRRQRLNHSGGGPWC